MTKREKLIERIRKRPPEADFSDVKALLEDFGWVLVRTRGSHNHFRKPGETIIVTVPVIGGRKVDRTYLSKIVDLLGLDEQGQ